MVARVPAVALAGGHQMATNGSAAAGPSVATSATPLTADELAKYGQLQNDARQAGVLESQKGGADATTWTIVGIVAVTCIALGLFFAIKEGGN
jgi:hypothetical protein